MLEGVLTVKIIDKTSALPQKSDLIRVWIVGSPHTGALPPAVVPSELRRRAESLGYTIELEAFQANGFASKFRQALLDRKEPEVLAFDNYGLVSGIRTSNGWSEATVSVISDEDPLLHPLMRTSIKPIARLVAEAQRLVFLFVGNSDELRVYKVINDEELPAGCTQALGKRLKENPR